jgi:hypothetical protein
MEQHLPVTAITDGDVTTQLGRFPVSVPSVVRLLTDERLTVQLPVVPEIEISKKGVVLAQFLEDQAAPTFVSPPALKETLPPPSQDRDNDSDISACPPVAALLAAIYATPISLEAGSNLGVSFEKAQLEEVDLVLRDQTVSIAQSGMGCIGIAGCVWNCAYYNVDYLSYLFDDNFDFGDTICDLATGTGVVGLGYVLLNSMTKNIQTHIVFTDKMLTSCFYDNIDTMKCLLESSQVENRTTVCSVEFDWLAVKIPEEMARHFTTILCSDVIYEPVVSRALLCVLKRLSFDRMFLVYKRRNDLKERFFFEELILFCDVKLAIVPIREDGDTTEFPFINIRKEDAAGMCIVLVTPKK